MTDGKKEHREPAHSIRPPHSLLTQPPDGTTRKGTMTDYKKQRRDDERPSSRPQAPHNRYEEQRSSGPARPRLNRESVDRAWESGAPNTHADYRPRYPRGTNPRLPRPSQNPSQGNWRNAQPSEHSSAPNDRPYDRRPFDNRQDHPRPERPPYNPNQNTPSNDEGPRPPRSFNTNNNPYNTSRPRFDDRRNDRPGPSDRPSSSGPGYGPRPNFRPQPNYNQRPPYRENDRYHGAPRNNERDERQPREFERDNRPPRNFDRQPGTFNRDSRPPYREDYRNDRQPGTFNRDNRPPRSFDRQPGTFNRDNRPPRGYERRGEPGRFERDNRPARYPQANTENPRWQSRPGIQGAQPEPQGQDEQFEGDYERFSGTRRRERPVTPYRPYPGKEKPGQQNWRDEHPAEEERHVTRLPDGRVLKGPRPVQRRDAEFWNDVSDETAQLVKPLHKIASPDEEIGEEQSTGGIEGKPTTVESVEKATFRPEKKVSKPRTRVASSVARAKKPRAKKGESKPPSKGPRPSQKGYKWPTT